MKNIQFYCKFRNTCDTWFIIFVTLHCDYDDDDDVDDDDNNS